MKVNMSLLEDELPVPADAGTADSDEQEAKEGSASRRPRLKVFLIGTFMVGGLALVVWSMTNFVNNMRLDNQGSASSVVYKMQDLESFKADGSKGSAAADVDEDKEPSDSVRAASDVPDGDSDEEDYKGHADTDDEDSDMPDNKKQALDDGTDSEPENDGAYADESEELSALRKEVQEARNEAALAKQELKNAEDMLDSSLAREAELKKQLDELSGND